MLETLFSYLIKLVETRENNKIIIYKEFVEPLKTEFNMMHSRYLDDFNNYKKSFLSLLRVNDFTVYNTILHNLGYEINEMVGKRIEIAHQIKSLNKVYEKKIHNEKTKELSESIVDYLNMDNFVLRREHNFISKGNYNSEILSLNPYRLCLKETMLISSNPIESCLYMIDQVLEHLKIKYEIVVDNFYSLKAYLFI